MKRVLLFIALAVAIASVGYFGGGGRASAQSSADRLEARGCRVYIRADKKFVSTCDLVTTPRAAAYTLWATAHGLVSFELSRHGPGVGYKRRYVAALDTLIRGLRAGAVDETNSATAAAKSSA